MIKLQLIIIIAFDNYVIKLKSHGVQVIMISDIEGSDTPDSIFPNNLISFHESWIVLFFLFCVSL